MSLENGDKGQIQPFAVTISRQLGSGGAYIGQRLAAKLNAMYLDHEILRHAAEKLRISEDYLESRDETVTPAWQSILLSTNYSAPTLYTPPEISIPTDQELYKVESEIISRIAQSYNAVIVGRGGSYILRQHPRHVSLFLYASLPFRQQRVQEIYHIPGEKALKLIESSDRMRARYLRSVAGQDWADARQYHFCLDTSILGLGKAESVIYDYLKMRFDHIRLSETKANQ